jgi:peptidoglycan hydrolase-like protein with peptidoglycan-binding domain
MSSRHRALAMFVGLLVIGPGVAHAAGSAELAALQVGLRAKKLYSGPIDGLLGPETAAGIAELQRRSGMHVTGVFGPEARAALGEYGRWTLGSRVLRAPARGWDVAAAQFLLSWQGFPSGPMDGSYTQRTAAAVRRFQLRAGVEPDGELGPETLALLRAPPPTSPLVLSWPLQQAVAGSFGPRGDGFHTGFDMTAPAGEPVAAAGSGRVTYAGWHPGGWGLLVTVAHGSGVRTMYAHLSRVAVRVGQAVRTGQTIGRVGASGLASGPHLHFEVRVRGAAVDPATALHELS